MEALMLCLTISLMHDLEIYVGDMKNAFCHNNLLTRTSGGVFVEPCEGLDLPSGSLIDLLAPVYGLDGAAISARYCLGVLPMRHAVQWGSLGAMLVL
eukprot:7340517-Pyramimonas_sp.AAC.1